MASLNPPLPPPDPAGYLPMDSRSWHPLEEERKGQDKRRRLFVVTHRLPGRLIEKDGGGWEFDFDKEKINTELDSGMARRLRFQPAFESLSDQFRIIYVGCPVRWPRPGVQEPLSNIPRPLQHGIREQMMRDHNCYPVFLKNDLLVNHNGFCNFFWPLAHFVLTPSSNTEFKQDYWEGYCRVNKQFADLLHELVDQPEDDMVWVHDYHLMMLPLYLRMKIINAKIGFCLYTPFPSSDVFRMLPSGKEVLRGMLNANTVSFQTHSFGRNFLTACQRLLGTETGPKGVSYYGRMVTVTTRHLGLHLERYESALKEPEVIAMQEMLRENYGDKSVLVSIDELDQIKGLCHKIMAFDAFLSANPDQTDKVVLVQVIVPPRHTHASVEEVESLRQKLTGLCHDLHNKHGPGHVFIVERQMSFAQTCAFLSLADVVLITSVREGLTLRPLEFIICQELFGKTGVLICSEMVPCVRNLAGAIRVNPWSPELVAAAIKNALAADEATKRTWMTMNLAFCHNNTASHWGKGIVDSMDIACSEMSRVTYRSYGIGNGFRVVGFDRNFVQLDVDAMSSSYKACTATRVLVFSVDGLLLQGASSLERSQSAASMYAIGQVPAGGDGASDGDGSPASSGAPPVHDGHSLMSVIASSLANDPNNHVYIVSSFSQDYLQPYVALLGGRASIIAEDGADCYFAPHGGSASVAARSSILENAELDKVRAETKLWKADVRDTLTVFARSTHGSNLNETDSGFTWHFDGVDAEYGQYQSRDLRLHLEQLTAGIDSVTVASTPYLLQIRASQFNRHAVLHHILSERESLVVPDVAPGTPSAAAGAPNSDQPFLMVVGAGDDLGDDEMFLLADSALTGSTYTCTIGHRPTKAQNYLASVDETKTIFDRVSK